MVHLEESNFKNYLISNAKGDWFVKGKNYKHSDILKSDGSSRYSNLPLIGTKVKDFKGKDVVNFSVYEDKNNKISIKLLNDNSSWETTYSSRHGGSWDKVFYDVCSWSNECYKRIIWKDIHQNFTPELRQKWEDKGLNYEQCKEWVNVGLKIDDYDFAAYLTGKVYQFKDNLNLEELREKYNAKQWFEKSYPRNDREQITELDISKKSLKGELDLSNFTNLEHLDCSNNNLTKIIISPSAKGKLKTIVFDNNNSLGKDSTLDYFSEFTNLETLKINATSFSGSLKPLKDLTNLQRLEIGGTDIDSGLEFLPESVEDLFTDSDEIYSNPLNPEPKVNKIREQLVPYEHNLKKWRKGTKTILLIGRSGRGKSTLANVILNKNDNFEEVFKESSKSVSETKRIQFEEFEHELKNEEEKTKKVTYHVIDTPGIGDTKMSDNEVLDIIAEAVYLVKDGLSQVLFVVDGRFDQYEMATYNLLRTIIFDENITKHTTIARTNFADFRKKERRQEDIDSMKKAAQPKRIELEKKISDKEKEMQKLSPDSKQYQELLTKVEELKKELKSTLSEIIESCQSKIVHVDNPKSNKIRSKSRIKLLDHLSKSCQEDYKPDKLKELSNEITEDMDKLLQSRKELEESMKELKTSSVSSTNSPFLKVTSITKHSASSSKLNTGKESSEIPELTTEDYAIAIAIGKIKELEDKKAKLRKEIADKEKIIRQKVLKHIFSNIEGINNELGGDIFLESVIGEHDWKKISPEFSDKGLVVNWLSKKFDYEQVQKWATALGNTFNPKNDAGFCAWLRDDEKLTVEKIKELDYPRDINKLREEYAQQLEKEVGALDKHNQKLGEGKKYTITKENFQQLIKLTFSVEVAQAYQAVAQAYQDQVYQARAQAWQAWAQAWQAEAYQAQAWQASAQAWQAWAQAYQVETSQAWQASAESWAKVAQDQSPQAVAQAYQDQAQAYQASAQASQAVAQAYQDQAQASQAEAQAEAQAWQAWAQASQASAQAWQASAESWAKVAQDQSPQAVAQAYQAQAQAYQDQAQASQAEAQAWQAWAQASAQAYQAQAQAEAQAYQASAQHFKINLTLEKIESFFIEVKEESEEGKIEVSINIQSKKN